MSNRRKIKTARLAYGHKDRKPHDFVKMATPTYWNGEPVHCERGMARVIETGPWYGSTEPVVLVWVKGEGAPYVLLDRMGQAWIKVTLGKGSPRYGHRNVQIDRESFRPHGGDGASE